MSKQIHDRDRDSIASSVNDTTSVNSSTVSSASSEASNAAQSIDVLFEKPQIGHIWEPLKPPPLLGEFFNSRYMIPLLFPSNPRMLAARPGKTSLPEEETHSPYFADSRSSSVDQPLSWQLNCRKLREVGLKSLQRLDGARRTAEWGNTSGYEEDGEPYDLPSRQLDDNEKEMDLSVDTNFTPLTRKSSTKGRGRLSIGETTPILERR